MKEHDYLLAEAFRFGEDTSWRILEDMSCGLYPKHFDRINVPGNPHHGESCTALLPGVRKMRKRVKWLGRFDEVFQYVMILPGLINAVFLIASIPKVFQPVKVGKWDDYAFLCWLLPLFVIFLIGFIFSHRLFLKIKSELGVTENAIRIQAWRILKYGSAFGLSASPEYGEMLEQDLVRYTLKTLEDQAGEVLVLENKYRSHRNLTGRWPQEVNYEKNLLKTEMLSAAVGVQLLVADDAKATLRQAFKTANMQFWSYEI